jgi:hypothetical protein
VVILLLFTWLLLLRAPFFAIPTIDWDESTFILIGQGILDGFLPYTKLWDFKPPFVFLFFAGAIAIFGKSIVAVRLAGCLWITASAYLLFRCALLLTKSRFQSFAIAMFGSTVVSLNTLWVSTEQLALTPLIASQLVLLQPRERLTKFYSCGLLIGAAGMFRPNVLYVAIFVGIYIAMLELTCWHAGRSAARLSVYIAGGLTVIIIAGVPYVIAQHVDLWFRSVFLAPWRWSTTNLANDISFIKDLANHAFWMTYPPRVTGIFVSLVLWFGGAVGMLFGKKRGLAQNDVVGIFVFCGGVAVSIILTGRSYSDYTYIALVVPWFVMLGAVGLNSIPVANIRSIISQGALILILIHGFFWVAPAYSHLYGRFHQSEDIFVSPEAELAAFLRRENSEGRPIYLLDRHIVYWLVDQYPLTRMSTQPSNITKRILIETIEGPNSTPESEMRKILAVSPEFVVKPTEEMWYFLQAPMAYAILTQTLRRDYDLLAMVGGREVYRKKEQH